VITGAPSKVTIVVEMNGAEDCQWIWDSFRAVILQAPGQFRNGVKVIKMRDGDCLDALRKLELAQPHDGGDFRG